MQIYKNGMIFKIERINNETDKQLINRGWFIVNQNIKDENEYNKIIKYSKIWYYYHYYGCEYNMDIMENLNSMIKNTSK